MSYRQLFSEYFYDMNLEFKNISETFIIIKINDDNTTALEIGIDKARFENLYLANMYIISLSKTKRKSGTELMNSIIRLAKELCIGKIFLDDDSTFYNHDNTCSFPLYIYYLLSKGKRWYSKFKFETDNEEIKIINKIRNEPITERIDEGSLSKNARQYLNGLKSTIQKENTVGFIFSKMNTFNTQEICFIDEIIKSFNPSFHDILGKNLKNMVLIIPKQYNSICKRIFNKGGNKTKRIKYKYNKGNKSKKKKI